MSSQLDFLSAFGFLRVKDKDQAVNINSISEIELLPTGEANITTVAGCHYLLPADQFNRLKEHCEGILRQYASAQGSRIVMPSLGRHH